MSEWYRKNRDHELASKKAQARRLAEKESAGKPHYWHGYPSVADAVRARTARNEKQRDTTDDEFYAEASQ